MNKAPRKPLQDRLAKQVLFANGAVFSLQGPFRVRASFVLSGSMRDTTMQRTFIDDVNWWLIASGL